MSGDVVDRDLDTLLFDATGRDREVPEVLMRKMKGLRSAVIH